MDIDVLAAPYGGVLTADALLVIEEEEQQFSSGSSSPPTKRLRFAGDTEKIRIEAPVHRAVLWSLSEYFASKVSCCRLPTVATVVSTLTDNLYDITLMCWCNLDRWQCVLTAGVFRWGFKHQA